MRRSAVRSPIGRRRANCAVEEDALAADDDPQGRSPAGWVAVEKAEEEQVVRSAVGDAGKAARWGYAAE
jgi:hypothetical protein